MPSHDAGVRAPQFTSFGAPGHSDHRKSRPPNADAAANRRPHLGLKVALPQSFQQLAPTGLGVVILYSTKALAAYSYGQLLIHSSHINVIQGNTQSLLQGMEPALYSPEDLLGDERRKEQILSHRPQQGNEDVDEQQRPSSSWFSHWFGLSDARSSTSGADMKPQALHKPPFVCFSLNSSSAGPCLI